MALLVPALAALALSGDVLADFYDPDSYDGNYEEDVAALYGDEYGGDLADGSTYMDPFVYGAGQEYGGVAGDVDGYYSDDLDAYYQKYGFYGDEYGDDYFFDDTSSAPDCVEDEPGKANTTLPACDLQVSGVDKTTKLQGGIDGTYKISGCWDGRPKYTRQKSPQDQERTLWFSKMFNDWDVSLGKDVNETGLLLYGGDDSEYSRPNFIPPNSWRMVTHSSPDSTEPQEKYAPIKMIVACANGKKLKREDVSTATSVIQPLLTDDETDAKYRALYTQYSGESKPDPTVNFTLVLLMVVLGVSVVLGIPYLLFGKKGGKGKSWAERLEDRRKMRGGHTM